MAGWQRWLAAAVLVLAAAVAVAAAVIGQLPFPTSIEAILAGVAVVSSLFVSPLQDRVAGWVNRPDVKRQALLHGTRLHDRNGRLPKVRDCTNPVDLGVHRASPPVAMPPYVPRDADGFAALADGFARGGLVIIEGPSASGKTRLAYEAMRRQAPGRTLIVPSKLRSLLTLEKSGARPANAVVWLDNLDDYFADSGLNSAVLDFLCPPGSTDVLVLATLRTEARNDLESRSSLQTSVKRAVDEVLNRASVIVLDRALSPAERERAERDRADSRIAAALDQHTGSQFAAYIAAAPEALHRWQAGRETPGGALVTAGVDARRAGLHTPLTRDLLAQLHTLYPGAGPDFEAALTWAIDPVRSASGCLIPLPDGTYQPFDYLLDHAQATPAMPSIPARAWPVYLRHADVADLTSLADAAYGAGHPDISEEALHRAAEADLDNLADAMRNLSVLQEAVAAAVKAREPLKQWLDSTADSCYKTGVMCEQQGRTEFAEGWYRMAAESHHVDAMKSLNRLLAAAGRQEEAEEWRGKAEAAENPRA
jgi:tetratricopeptide (TPR) repeat protein